MSTLTATSDRLDAAYAECERLAGRDKPHLYAAAGLFERPAVKRAFVATYASMRLIDDAVDGIEHRALLSESDQKAELSRVSTWLERVERARSGEGGNEPTWDALADTFSRFAFPIDPWTSLAKAMSSDIVSSSFRTWDDLRQYMQGASVAPAVVFMYLVLMRPNASGIYRTQWSYDEVYAVTEDLAIFCYLVHILRDVASDLSLGKTGLVYLPDEELARFGLDSRDLHAMRESGRASAAYSDFARRQAERARGHLRAGRSRMDKVLAESGPAHGKALTTLVDTYERILNDLQDCDFDVFSMAVSGIHAASKNDFD